MLLFSLLSPAIPVPLCVLSRFSSLCKYLSCCCKLGGCLAIPDLHQIRAFFAHVKWLDISRSRSSHVCSVPLEHDRLKHGTAFTWLPLGPFMEKLMIFLPFPLVCRRRVGQPRSMRGLARNCRFQRRGQRFVRSRSGVAGVDLLTTQAATIALGPPAVLTPPMGSFAVLITRGEYPGFRSDGRCQCGCDLYRHSPSLNWDDLRPFSFHGRPGRKCGWGVA